MQASVTDTDGDAITPLLVLKPEHDDNWEGRSIDPRATTSFRNVFQVPSDATLQQLKIATTIDNSGGYSQNFVYDISQLK